MCIFLTVWQFAAGDIYMFTNEEVIKDLIQRIAVLETHVTILMGERPVIRDELLQIGKKEVEFENRIKVNNENIDELDEKVEKTDEKFMRILKIVGTAILTVAGTAAQIFLH